MSCSVRLLALCFASHLMLLLPAARAAETCTCSAKYSKIESDWTWVDYLCVFPSTSSGPYTVSRQVSWKHTFGDRLVSKPSLFLDRWDELLEIAAGEEKTQCETKNSDFQKLALKLLIKGCKRDGGENCDSLKMICKYEATK